jgi:predicted nuclease of predicted toxin-antitoxin system
MKVKLDENLGTRLQAEFRAAGHDVATVAGEGLSGTSDEDLFQVCGTESRVLVTLDVGFGNLLRFPCEGTAGVAVLRVPEGAHHALMRSLATTLTAALATRSIEGRLWIVEPGRIRERIGGEPGI